MCNFWPTKNYVQERRSKASDILNNSNITGETVKEALNGMAGTPFSVALENNVTSPITLISYPATEKFRWLFYTISRGTIYTIADMKCVTDGNTVVGGIMKNTSPSGQNDGITISKTVLNGNVLIQYVSTNTGINGTFSYGFMKL